MAKRASVVVVAMMAVLLPVVMAGADQPGTAYAREIEQFRQRRNDSLRKNWIVLAGLSWLKPGQNRVGSAQDNDVVLPKGPARLFVFEVNGENVSLRLENGAEVQVDGKPGSGTMKMAADVTGKPTVVAIASLRLTVIERGDKMGVRVKDLENPRLKTFKGTEWFPIDPKLRVEARWVPERGRKIAITNVLGQTEMTDVPGEAVFTVNGKELHLQPIQEDPDELFFIFGDGTKGETYPGGRFLYTEMPRDGKVVLDFNKAFSPPCAFTPYATCPLAPKENRLPVRIEAGEKYEGHH
jgi:uncharacterized protein